jgi:hypothetical protein
LTARSSLLLTSVCNGTLLLLLLLLPAGLQFMVRFRQPDQAQELLQAFAAAAEAGEHKQVAGCAAELRVVEVEEEEQYYKRVSNCCSMARWRCACGAAQCSGTHDL